MNYWRISTSLISAGMVLAAASAQAEDINPSTLLNMSLDQLSNIEVTSVSKTPEKANQAAAAIFVITQEDIKRSGATNIPDLLRMAPGIDVAQAGSHDWAVTSRGFNDQFADRLLVLIDGRTVYSPLFSGVIWQNQDVPLQDIDRIEVIRGPGATQWGANAVNGVINIITKNAKDTVGGFASTTEGNMVRTQDTVREGIKTGDDSYARVYAKYDDDAPEFNVGTGRSDDGWQKRQAGFRSDSKLTDQDSLTLQGDTYTTHETEDYQFPSLTTIISSNPSDIETSGANVLARWTRNITPQSSTSTQFYLDNTQYKTSWVSYNATTADLDFQHTWTGWDRNEVIWGAGYRFISDHDAPSAEFTLSPADLNYSTYSAFLQDKYTLHPDDVFLTLGSKFEDNTFTGVEVQPSARLSWLISDTQMTWGSISHAVHTPDRYTSAGQLELAVAPPGALYPGSPLTEIKNVDNPQLDSEELTAYELGYRVQPTKTVSLDVATFYNDYSKLFLSQSGIPVSEGPFDLLTESETNAYSAHSLGYEISAKVDAMKNWQLSGSYSYLDLHFNNPTTTLAFTAIGQQPKNTFNVRSTYLFPYDIQMTNSLYYVNGFVVGDIPGYYRFDTKLSKELMSGVEVSLVGQNLLTAYHREYEGFLYQNPIEVGRSMYANLTVKF